MKNSKFMVALLCLVLCSSLVFAQKRNETTVEDEYLSTVEGFIITELTNAQDYDSKEKALDFLEEAIKNGRTSPDMEHALHSIAGEGVFHESRTNGRLVNNFPDLRARACGLLGEIGDEYSIKTLTEVILSDNEPMVTMAAIKALGNTKIEDADKAVEIISWSEKKFSMLNPTPSLADEVLVGMAVDGNKVANQIDNVNMATFSALKLSKIESATSEGEN